MWKGSCYETMSHHWVFSGIPGSQKVAVAWGAGGTEQIWGGTNLGSNTVNMSVVTRNMYTLKMIFQYNSCLNKSY